MFAYVGSIQNLKDLQDGRLIKILYLRFTAVRKDAGLYCGSRLRSGQVFAYVRSIQNLKDLKGGCRVAGGRCEAPRRLSLALF